MLKKENNSLNNENIANALPNATSTVTKQNLSNKVRKIINKLENEARDIVSNNGLNHSVSIYRIISVILAVIYLS